MLDRVCNINECTVTGVLHLGKQVCDKLDRSTRPLEIVCWQCTHCQNPYLLWDLPPSGVLQIWNGKNYKTTTIYYATNLNHLNARRDNTRHVLYIADWDGIFLIKKHTRLQPILTLPKWPTQIRKLNVTITVYDYNILDLTDLALNSPAAALTILHSNIRYRH